MTPSEELLSAYLDDELSSQERVDVERRLASDSQWRETLEKLQEVRGWVRELPAVVPSRPKSILQMLAEEKPNSADDGVRLADHSQHSTSPSSWKWMMSLAAAGLALIGTTLWWLSDQSQEVALGSKFDSAVTDSPINPESLPAPMGRGRVAVGSSSVPPGEAESVMADASGNLAANDSPTTAEAPAMKASAPAADLQPGGRVERSAKSLPKESNSDEGSVGTKPGGNLADRAGNAPNAGFGGGDDSARFGGTGGLGGGGIGSMPAPGEMAMEAAGDANAAFAPANVTDPSPVPAAPNPTAPSPTVPSPKAMASSAGMGRAPGANAGAGGSGGAAGGMRSVERDDSRTENANEADAFRTTPRYLTFQRFYTEQVDEPKIASYFLVKPTVESEAISPALAADKTLPNMFSEQLKRVEPTGSPSAAGEVALTEGDAMPEGGVLLERGAIPAEAAVPGRGGLQGDKKQARVDAADLQDAEAGSAATLVTIPAVHLQVPVAVFADLEKSASESDWKLWPSIDSTKTLETLAAPKNATQTDPAPQDPAPLDPASDESIERFSKAEENVWLLKISREQYEALRARWSEKRLDVSEVLDDRKLQLAQSTVAPKNPSLADGSPADSVPTEMQKDLSTNSANQGSEARSEGRGDFIFIILQQR